MAKRSSILAPGVVAKYVEGVKAVKKNGDYDKFIQSHYTVLNKVHRTPLFLPWHRAFLMDFEDKLQTALSDPDFGLPYWDFAADSTAVDNRGALWTKDYLGGAGNPVADGPFTSKDWPIYSPDSRAQAKLCRALAATGKFPTITTTQQLFAQKTYDGFRRALEGEGRAFHDWLHGWVGGSVGQMSSTPNSPNDPAFWLLHCNVDRIWAQWQRVRPTAKVEAPGFPDFGPKQMMPATFDGTGAKTVESVLKIPYSYDTYYGNSTPLVVKVWTSNSYFSGTDDEVQLYVYLTLPDTTDRLAHWLGTLDPKYCDHADPFERGQVDTFTIPGIVFTPDGTDTDLAGKQTPVCFYSIRLYKRASLNPLSNWTVMKVQLNSDGALWNTNPINKTLTNTDNQVTVRLDPPVF